MVDFPLHAFEAGRRGKPDELDAGIAHLIGASFLEKDRQSRFDIRVSGKFRQNKPYVDVSGEVSEHLLVEGHQENIAQIVQDHYRQIHQSPEAEVIVETHFKLQARALAQNKKAGDSGTPIAVAFAHTPNQLPFERYLAVEIRDVIDWIYQNNGKVPEKIAEASGVKSLEGLRADGKVSVAGQYYAGKGQFYFSNPLDITIAVEHEKVLKIAELRCKLTRIVSAVYELANAKMISLENASGKVYKRSSFDEDKIIMVNGYGDWNAGGWLVDEGNREAKSYRDGFATHGVMEDSFSGEDPSKPSGTGTFLARYLAKQIVNAGDADFANVTLGYRIGKEKPYLNVASNGTKRGRFEDHFAKLWTYDLSIGSAIEFFDLQNPQLYRQIVKASDFFHDLNLPWNR